MSVPAALGITGIVLALLGVALGIVSHNWPAATWAASSAAWSLTHLVRTLRERAQ